MSYEMFICIALDFENKNLEFKLSCRTGTFMI